MRKARSKSIFSIKWVERQVQSFTQTQGWWAQPDVMFVTLKASLKHVLEAPVIQVRLKIQQIQTPLILINREQDLVCQAWQNKANNDTWVASGSALLNWCLDYRKQIYSSSFHVSQCLRRSSPCHSFSNPSFISSFPLFKTIPLPKTCVWVITLPHLIYLSPLLLDGSVSCSCLARS